MKKRAMRDREGLFIIEGVRVLEEAINFNGSLEEVLVVEDKVEEIKSLLCRASGEVPLRVVSPSVIEEITTVVTPQGVYAVAEQNDLGYEDFISRDLDFVIIASSVRDPGNLGVLLRVADAAGADGVISTPDSVDIFNPKVVRAACGAHFHIPIVREIELEMSASDLRSKGIKIFGLDPHEGKPYEEEDLTVPVAFVFGNEAEGLSEKETKFIDEKLKIDMPGKAESLNLGSAAAIVLFEVVRQRKGARKERENCLRE